MITEITPEETGGEVTIPPSKSYSHRAIFAASLANGTSRLTNLILSNDIRATIEACRDLGADIEAEAEEDGLFTLMITGTPHPKADNCLINCHESGSTIRMLIPIAAIDADNAVLIGEGRLTERPLGPIIDLLREKGVSAENQERQLPLILNGHLEPGVFELPGDISSQFVTGLLFALPLLDGDSEIRITSKMQSAPYINMTIAVIEQFGIEIDKVSAELYRIPGNQHYKPNSFEIEGDFSQAAFWLVNGAVNGRTELYGLPEESIQGDFQVIDILRKSDAQISWDPDKKAWISEPSKTRSFRLDASDVPDLIPPLSVFAALSEGQTEIFNAARLRIKESDRLMAVSKMLSAYGVEVVEKEDSLIIRGQERLDGCTIDSFHDHRIAMSAAIASGRADGPVYIENSEAVSKSWPNFWDEFEDAGGQFKTVAGD